MKRSTSPWARPLGWAVAVALLLGGLLWIIGSQVVLFPSLMAAVLALGLLAPARRARLSTQAPPPAALPVMPEGVKAILQEKVAAYRRLRPQARGHFESRVQRFLQEHRFTFRQGAVDDLETRVLVAASAAQLLLGRDLWDFPRACIAVYPDEVREGIAGLAWGGANPIVSISQKFLRESFRRPSDGYHVGLHELAHLLDFDSIGADGVPTHLPAEHYRPWVELLGRELRRARRGSSLLGNYAGTNEAELFAVSVEAFFEQPSALKQRHPELYATLAEFFNQDPAAPRG